MESSKTVIVGGKVNTTKKMNEGKLKSILSKIGIGAAGVAGGALLATPVSKLINMVTDNNEVDTLPDPIIVIHDRAPKANQVTDDMSLKDALMVAREEVGPGGTFVHKGSTYSTYTKEEENAMTDSHKQIFAESTNHARIDSTQISEGDIKAITLDGTHQNEAIDHPDVHPTVEEKVQINVASAAETAKTTDATATAEVASGFVEPLDEMLADVVAPSSENVAEQAAEATASVDVASEIVEPLDKMLADVVVPSSENVAEQAAEVTATAEVASGFVEPLDEMLAGNNEGLKLIGENWVLSEVDGSKDHVVYYTQNGQSIVKIDQNNDGVFDTVLKTHEDGSFRILTSNGEEAFLTEQELEKVLYIENKEDVYDIKSKHTFVVMDTDGDGETDSFISSNTNGEVHISSSKGNATLILDDVAQLVDAKDQVHHANHNLDSFTGQNENDDSSMTNDVHFDNSAVQTDNNPIDDTNFSVSLIDDF